MRRNTVQVTFSGTGNPVFDWTNNNTAIGLAASGSGNISFTSAGVSNPVTGTITVTPSAGGCTGASQNFDITVIPAPIVNNPGNTLACAGAPVNIIFSGTGNTYSWTNDRDPAIGLGSSGTGNISFNAASLPADTVANIVRHSGSERLHRPCTIVHHRGKCQPGTDNPFGKLRTGYTVLFR
jgi:hypothetical protein